MKPVLLTDGEMPPELLSSNCIVPSPLPVLTVTVQVVPDTSVTLVTLALAMLPGTKEKLLAANPLIEAAKIAVYCTEVALVSVLFTAVSELMVVLGELSRLTPPGLRQ